LTLATMQRFRFMTVRRNPIVNLDCGCTKLLGAEMVH
jgi:hypothetical protein